MFRHSYTINQGVYLREYFNGEPYIEQENLVVEMFDTIQGELITMMGEGSNNG